MRSALNALAAAICLIIATPAVAQSACSGAVVIGEGDGQISTMVANRSVAGSCINDLIVDTSAEGANYGNHGEFVKTVHQLATHWAKQELISKRDAAQLVQAAARSDVGKRMQVRIIAFNDFHGNIDGTNLTFRSSSDALPNNIAAGGVDYLAGLVQQLQAEAPNNVVVSAGDLIGASPLNSALFHDEPTIETMNRLGLEFNAVGNHEFDEGRDELLRLQKGGCHPTDSNSCQGELVGTGYPFKGAEFEFLAANVVDSVSGKTLFPSYGVKSFKGNRIAFVGMTLEGTPSIVTPAGITGLEFRDEADTVNALASQLKRGGIDAVVVLLHEGGYAPGSINGCNGVSGPIVDIVSRLDDVVDLVVSGHTHQAYNCKLPNSSGRDIAVTSAGSYGRLLTSIDLTFDTQKKQVVAVNAKNRVVDRNNSLGSATPIQPVAEISNIISRYNTIVQPIANRVVGSITADLSRSRNGTNESSLGDVIADAQLEATAAADKGAAVIAFMNSGGIRADFSYVSSSAGEGDGNVTYSESFTVQPFGNSLVVKTFTGQQIYELLEQQWAVGQYADGGRTLQPSKGFTYKNSFQPNVTPLGGHYVCDGSVMLNGVAIDKNANYRVTMNSFLASGGDNFSLFTQGANQLGGAVDIDAMASYFANHSPVAPGPQSRIQQVQSCL